MRAKDFRKAIPVGVKLHSCLLLLGFTEEEIAGGLDWDHTPALALRSVDAETGQMVPHPNDPRFIEPRRRAEHAVKTRGNGATTAGSDIGTAAKLKRIEKDPAGGAEFRRKLLATKAGEEVKPARRPKPKIKTRKQPWPSGRKIPTRSKP